MRLCSLCLLALLDLVQLGLALRHGGFLYNSRPAFFACEDDEGVAVSCSTQQGVPSRQMDELLAAGYRRMRAVAAMGRRPLVVHIGADGLRNSAKWTDVHLYSQVLSHAGVPSGALRLAFVEPMEEKSQTFWQGVERLPVNRSQVSLVTAMVDGSCPSPTRSMYRVAPEAYRDFHLNTLFMGGWSSANPRHPLNVIRSWARQHWRYPCEGFKTDCTEDFQRFSQMPNLTDYIQEVSIPCRTLEALVEDVGAEVEDLAMLVVDAEGLDASILLSLVDDETFMPGFIMWEGFSADDASTPQAQIQARLRERGYRVGVKPGLGAKGDATNSIAVFP